MFEYRCQTLEDLNCEERKIFEKERTILYWEVNAKRYNEPITEIDTINHGILDLELVGSIKRCS